MFFHTHFPVAVPVQVGSADPHALRRERPPLPRYHQGVPNRFDRRHGTQTREASPPQAGARTEGFRPGGSPAGN
jgi:hypothetical protein